MTARLGVGHRPLLADCQSTGPRVGRLRHARAPSETRDPPRRIASRVKANLHESARTKHASCCIDWGDLFPIGNKWKGTIAKAR